MSVWAIADLHLAKATPSKEMSFFGGVWENYMEKISMYWREMIAPEDLVLVAGDISWAMQFEKARIDLDWIADLPGTKVMIRGNHDYWWESLKKMKEKTPPSIHFLQNTAFHWNGIGIGGTRLWDSNEYFFKSYINFQERLASVEKEIVVVDSEKIFTREIQRLILSLEGIDPFVKTKICMTHYPPIGAELAPSIVSGILEKFGVTISVFGHLHNVKKETLMFGEARGVRYHLTSCDYLDFRPLKIL